MQSTFGKAAVQSGKRSKPCSQALSENFCVVSWAKPCESHQRRVSQDCRSVV